MRTPPPASFFEHSSLVRIRGAGSKEVDEVKAIHDKALALECYAQQAMNFDAERQAAEIRIRAERKAGELLKERAKAKPGRKSQLASVAKGNSVPV